MNLQMIYPYNDINMIYFKIEASHLSTSRQHYKLEKNIIYSYFNYFVFINQSLVFKRASTQNVFIHDLTVDVLTPDHLVLD